MAGELEGQTAVKAAIDAVLAGSASTSGAMNWYAKLEKLLFELREGRPTLLQDRAFLQRLWDEQNVSATGSGTVKVAPALDHPEFRNWFAAKAATPLPDDPQGRAAFLTQFWDELNDKTKALCGRTPWLKNSRALCALYPELLTTIADNGKLLKLHEAMGGSNKDHPVKAHLAVRTKVNEAMGIAPSGDPGALVRRLCIPWFLYEKMSRDSQESASAAPEPEAQSSVLEPIPVALRRKGLTALKGYFGTLLTFMEDLSEGVSRDDFVSLIKQHNPNLADSSVGTVINVIAREFDLCKREGDVFRLSARGINLRNSRDPDELADHLLTRVFGPDHVLKRLQSGPAKKAELLSLLQDAHPGWTTDFAASSLIAWMVGLDLAAPDGTKLICLTDRGRRWADMIAWTPEKLSGPAEEVVDGLDTVAQGELLLPEFDELLARLAKLASGHLKFDRSQVEQLHAGLWAHPVRHFAVLSGISGSGKTQLALKYALALTGQSDGNSPFVRVVPIQPGWFDPAPLLGYVNPIQDTAYRSTPFLELVLRAANDPQRPYVAILDEMNLSHPEQYLAPILSAMETHGWLDLHQNADSGAGVPARIQYPANLCIVGTLNMDETTHGLSDKVLDRACTLEFWNIDVEAFPGWSTISLPPESKQRAQKVLTALGKCLSPARQHFGWRTLDDILNALLFREKLGASNSIALDDAVYSKILPKLRGDATQRFQKALQESLLICKENELKRSAEKLAEMQHDLQATGSARYWR